ncbi:MAG: hypothetical protein HYX55_11155 [Chloroflexi bacterium]|nr:hypothetical protein [Chloroflexota bacterium]
MRLPFGLGRRSSSGDGASSGGSGTGSVATAAPAAAAPSRAWASLPPIQRTAGAMPLVAAPGSFAGELPGSQPLPPIVQPLGHEVSALATPGLVVARVRPVQAAAAGAVPAPVQRRTARGAARPTPAATPAFAPEAEVAEHAAPAVATPAPAPAAPIRTMPTVSREAVRVPDRPLTSAASAARPAAVQRAAAAAAAATSAPSGALPPPSSGGMRRVPAAAPASQPTVSRQASSSHADHPAHAIPAATTRSGIGEPMTAVPASARPVTAPGPVVSRSTTAGPMPIAASSLRSPIQRSAAGDASAGARPVLPSGSPATAAPQAAPARLPDLPHLPVARSSATASAPTASATAAPASAPVPTVAREYRPTAGANPIRTSLAIQRDEADDLEDDGDEGGLPSPWWAPDGGSHAAAGPGSQSMTDGGLTSIQRSVPDGGLTRSSSPAPAGSTAPSQGSAAGRAPIQRVAAPAARPSPASLTLPHAPVQRASSASAAPAETTPPTISFPARSPGGAMVQTSSAPASAAFSGPHLGAPTGPTVQREGTTAALSAPTPVPPAGQGTPASPAGPASAGSGSGSGSHSERDLDELAQALFGRIRGRLRSDLIYDREAKGLTFDNV